MLVCGWYALGGCVLGILKRLSCFVAKKFCDSSLMFCVVFSERVVADNISKTEHQTKLQLQSKEEDA